MIVTVETLKSILGIQGSSEDTLLQTILTNAQGVAETVIGRPIEKATYTDVEMDGHGEQVLMLKHFPIVTFTKIEYRDGTTWTEVTDDYHVQKDTGMVRFPCSIVPRGFSNVRATYEAGWDTNTIPANLKHTVIDIASTMYNTRGSAGIKREKIDGSEIEFSQDGAVSTATDSILQSYRSYNV